MHKMILAAVLAVAAAPAFAQTPAARTAVGEKVDSGLGNLPPFIEWHRHPQLRRLAGRAVAQAEGQKLDSGLGTLPPYAQWNRHPELKALVVAPRAPAGTTMAALRP